MFKKKKNNLVLLTLQAETVIRMKKEKVIKTLFFISKRSMDNNHLFQKTRTLLLYIENDKEGKIRA